MAAPIVSISLGNDGIFLIGGETKDTPPTAVRLRTGDVVVMAGRSRRHLTPPHLTPPHSTSPHLTRWVMVQKDAIMVFRGYLLTQLRSRCWSCCAQPMPTLPPTCSTTG